MGNACRLVLAIGFVILGACDGGGGGTSVCVPGSTMVCNCTAEQTGVQVCSDDGTFAACECAVAVDAGVDAEPLPSDASPSADANPATCALGHNCDVHATCADSSSGFTCTCNPGYDGDGVLCVGNEDTLVADLAPRTAGLTVSGAGEFTVSGLSRVGIDIEVIEKTISATRVQRSPGLVSYPDITLRHIVATTGDLNNLAAWINAPSQRSISLTVTGLNGEFAMLVMLATPVGGDPTIAAGALAEVVLRISDIPSIGFGGPVPAPLEVHPGKRLEIEGVTVGHAPFPNLDFPLEDETTNVVWRMVGSDSSYSGGAAMLWIADTVNTIEIDVQNLQRRNMSVIDLDAAGLETGRVNMFETWPYRLNFFNPTRPYGTTRLIDLFIAIDYSENG